jgi:hypothetical protein
MSTTKWRCKQCDRRVEMHYNHVGNCGPDATEDDCPGTFSHPLRVRGTALGMCELRDQDLTHDMVEVWDSAKKDEEEEA